MELNCFIRKLRPGEIGEALCLTWNVFQQYEAPDYTQEGIAEFYRSIHDEKYLSELCWYGAFVQDDLVGVLATRSAGTHIALFFVKGKYHRQGIGGQWAAVYADEAEYGPLFIGFSAVFRQRGTFDFLSGQT